MPTILHAESSLGRGGQEIRTLAETRWLIGHGWNALIACQPNSLLFREARAAAVPVEPIRMRSATDVGALINAGAGGGPPLFVVSETSKLRVYVNVPEGYSQAAKPGIKADLTLTEFADRRFQGTLVRTASAIDPSTRTLLAEIDLDNPTGELLSGSYAQVHIKLPRGSSAFTIPVNALLFRSEGLRVATLPDGKHVNLQPIQIGQDYGSDVEVVAGLNGDEKIIVNPPDSIVAGEEVRIASGTAAAGTSQ